ncbi:unnamed protein product [Phytophthora lilii]|uniref:Unnamed protein product n=1 Tax=Phytophthora lilii TaxID=2077276 RepID=A0A9W6WL48_9STRA|nr:unnamed protein product [Phytophthora lilii]
MRQVEKECNELDWTSSGGAAVGGSRVAFRDEEASESGSLSGHRLGGKSAGTSRLLSITPPDSNASEVSTSDQTPSAEETQSTAPNKKVVTTTTNKDVEMENVEKTTTETVLSQHAEVSRSKPHSPTVREATILFEWMRG